MVAQQHVHDLPVLINGTEGVSPAITDLEQGLVHPPLVSDRMAVPACGLDEPRREGMDPVVDGARIDAEAPLSQPLRDISVTEPETQVPADSQRDDLVLYVMMDSPGGLAHDLAAQRRLWLVPERPPARYSGPLGVI